MKNPSGISPEANHLAIELVRMGLETLIMTTPTGEKRNRLTEANILFESALTIGAQNALPPEHHRG